MGFMIARRIDYANSHLFSEITQSRGLAKYKHFLACKTGSFNGYVSKIIGYCMRQMMLITRYCTTVVAIRKTL